MDLMNKGAWNGERYRVIVSTDIGGSDPDDFQSMAHFLLYADLFDVEGLISSPWGDGRASDILYVIDQYEKDYGKLCNHSTSYPAPDYLRKVTKQGAIDIAPYQGYMLPTPGSQLIVEAARKADERPLYILAWGLLEDIAQALHDAPDILPKLRVHYIGGPNKMMGLNAYMYILKTFPDLWIIENNSTYRGWFVGGNQENDLNSFAFHKIHAAGHGALGDYFFTHTRSKIKMGDTPTVAWLFAGEPENPELPSLGGMFEKVTKRPITMFDRDTTEKDNIEVFGIAEYVFTGPEIEIDRNKPAFYMNVFNHKLPGYYCGNGKYKIRIMSKGTGLFKYSIESKYKELDGKNGSITVIEETSVGRQGKGQKLKNWWSDTLRPEFAEAEHKGAKTINVWREIYLRDFEERLDRCL